MPCVLLKFPILHFSHHKDLEGKKKFMFRGFSLQNGSGHFFPIYLCKWFTRYRSIKLYILPSKNFIQSKPDESQ